MKTLFSPDLTLEEAQVLINSGANVNQQDLYGQTRLHRVTDTNIAKLLILHGADINTKDMYGHSPIFYAQDIDLLRVLIDNNADLNLKDNDGETPLFYLSGYTDNALLLIENGADPYIINHYNQTLLHISRNIDVFIRLINHDTDLSYINLKDIEGFTVLDALTEDCKPHIEHLVKHGAICSQIKMYMEMKHYFDPKQQEVFDMFMTITNNDDDFFAMCLAYQESIRNHVQMDLKDINI